MLLFLKHCYQVFFKKKKTPQYFSFKKETTTTKKRLILFTELTLKLQMNMTEKISDTSDYLNRALKNSAQRCLTRDIKNETKHMTFLSPRKRFKELNNSK